MHDLIVVGGGVIGLSIAWEAAVRGLRVVVLEAGRTGRASSWAGAGMLPTPQRIGVEEPLERLRLRSHQLHASWAERLREVTGIDTQYRRCGAVAIGRTVGEFATLAANEAWWGRHGMEYQRLGPEELVGRLPGLRPEPAIRGGWFFPEDCQLRNPCHLQALRKACIQNGVVIEEDSPALSWTRQQDRLTAVQTSRGTYKAAAFCVAAGAWSRDVGLPETRPLGVLPIRGQMILYRFPAAPFSSIVHEGHLYLVPRADGRLLAGSCEEEAGFDARTTPERIEQLHRWAQSLLGPLPEDTIEKCWAGLRPGTLDGFPYLGQHPMIQNLFVATGHFRHGLHLSTGTAELMVQLICGEKVEIDLSPFRIR